MIRRMRGLLKVLLVVVVVAIVVFAGAWVWAGRLPGPTIQIQQPEKFLGQTGTLAFMLEAPGGRFTHAEAAVEQNGTSHSVFALEPGEQRGVEQDIADRLYISRPIG